MTRLGDAVASDPERMTTRARQYLMVAFARHSITAALCLGTPAYLGSRPFVQIREVLPFIVWGVAFTATAVACGFAVISRSQTAARTGLLMSAVLTAVWACGFGVALLDGGPGTSPAGALGFASLALKDIIVCRQPMRSPFEPLIRRMTTPQ